MSLYSNKTAMKGSSSRRKTSSFQHPPSTLHITSPLLSPDLSYSASQGHLFLFFSFYTIASRQGNIELACSFQHFFSADCRVRWITSGAHEPREPAVHRLRSDPPTPSSGKTNRAAFSPRVRRLWSSGTSVNQTGSCGWGSPPCSSATCPVPPIKERHCGGDAGMVQRHNACLHSSQPSYTLQTRKCMKTSSDMVWTEARLLSLIASLAFRVSDA